MFTEEFLCEVKSLAREIFIMEYEEAINIGAEVDVEQIAQTSFQSAFAATLKFEELSSEFKNKSADT